MKKIKKNKRDRFLLLIFLVMSCTSTETEVTHRCKVTCDECKNLIVDCDDEKDRDTTEITLEG